MLLPMIIADMISMEDRDFMEHLYAQYHGLMFSTAWRYTRDADEVADIVSECCVKLIQHLTTVKKLETPQLMSYIVVTVKHTAFDVLKKQAIWCERCISIDSENVLQVAGTENVEESVELKEKLSTVLRAIDSLPEKERLVLILYSQKQKNFREIASIAGLSEESVHKYLSRARSKIRAAICKEEGNS